MMDVRLEHRTSSLSPLTGMVMSVKKTTVLLRTSNVVVAASPSGDRIEQTSQTQTQKTLVWLEYGAIRHPMALIHGI